MTTPEVIPLNKRLERYERLVGTAPGGAMALPAAYARDLIYQCRRLDLLHTAALVRADAIRIHWDEYDPHGDIAAADTAYAELAAKWPANQAERW